MIKWRLIMEKSNRISDELLSKISGGELNKRTKLELVDAIDYYKAAGLELDYFIELIIPNYTNKEEVEAFIRSYWETGKY